MSDTLPSEKRNRIFFPGNPWPKGHEIVAMKWEASFRPESGFWFNFSLMSADYYAEDLESDEVEADDVGWWESKGGWSNYHACCIEGWGYEHSGFLGIEAGVMFDFASLSNRSYHLDPCPREIWDENAFHIYLIGHDSVADHHIRFGPRQPDNRFSLGWSGKIALTYTGGEAYEYGFQAYYDPLSLDKVYLPAKTEKEAQALLLEAFQEPDLFRIVPAENPTNERPGHYAAVLK